MDKRAKWPDRLGSLIVTAALSGALSMIATEAMGLSVSPGMIFLLCAAIGTVMGVASLSRSALAVCVALTSLGAAIWSVSPAKPLAQFGAMVRALIAYNSGEGAMLTEHAAVIACSLAVLLSVAIHWMERMSGGVYPALTLSVIVIMGGWMMDQRMAGAYVIPAICALAAMFARSGDGKLSYVRALPAGLIVALLAFALLPSGNPTWAPLREGAERVRQLFYDYFLFTESRVIYSLYPDGMQPQGDVLGGPASPNERPVMRVQSNDVLLLRGSIKRTYTTYSWSSSAVNNRYLFKDPTKRGTRDQVFDANRLNDLPSSDAFQAVSGKVTMLSDGISTFFVPHRLLDIIAGLEYAIYYNSSGEVFITRGVVSGDAYEFIALAPGGESESMERLIREAQSVRDDQYQIVVSEYSSLPHGIESGVYELARRVTQNARTPYQKALALQAHLLGNYTYDMDVPYPPRDRDFVSYFLLDDKRGYCSYFASAMAVMARMAGLPARYIEGYMVPPGGDEGKIVTGYNAHAWVEIYFHGVGWVSFNPTPGDGETQAGDSGQGGAPGEDQPTAPPTEEPQGSDPGDSEEDPLSDEPQGGDPEDELSDDPQQGAEPEQSETPPDPSAPPEPEDEDPPGENSEENGEDAPRSLWWLYLLLGAVIVAGAGWVIRRRWRASDPKTLVTRPVSDEEKLMIWYRALLLALQQQGQAPNASESPRAFALRLQEAGVAGDAFFDVAVQLERCRYARRRIEASVFRQAERAYRRQIGQMKWPEKLGWIRRRIGAGLGDMERLP